MLNTLQNHLLDRLQNPTKFELSEEDKKIIQFEGIEAFIFRKLTSKKFRKTALDPDSEQQIKTAIHTNVSENKPIKFTYPFGGYKIWRVPTYPNVDWAEFFTISYVLRYVSPILQAYKPGVELYFSSDDVVIELIDNYPREDLDAYVTSFKQLLIEFGQFLPPNMHLELKQVVPDYYTLERYDEEFAKLYQEFKEQGFTHERMQKLEQYFTFNFQVDGKHDYSNASKQELHETWYDLMFWSDAYLKLSKRKDFVRGEDKIVLFSQPIPLAIDIGSNSVSKAKFWAGIGVIEQSNDKLYERIMSPKQWREYKEEVVWEEIDVIQQENFAKVPVFNRRFDFIN